MKPRCKQPAEGLRRPIADRRALPDARIAKQLYPWVRAPGTNVGRTSAAFGGVTFAAS